MANCSHVWNCLAHKSLCKVKKKFPKTGDSGLLSYIEYARIENHVPYVITKQAYPLVYGKYTEGCISCNQGKRNEKVQNIHLNLYLGQDVANNWERK